MILGMVKQLILRITLHIDEKKRTTNIKREGDVKWSPFCFAIGINKGIISNGIWLNPLGFHIRE